MMAAEEASNSAMILERIFLVPPGKFLECPGTLRVAGRSQQAGTPRKHWKTLRFWQIPSACRFPATVKSIGPKARVWLRKLASADDLFERRAKNKPRRWPGASAAWTR